MELGVVRVVDDEGPRSPRQPLVGHVVDHVHAGWRGTCASIVSASVATMCEAFGSDPGDLAALVGPSACVECFEVGDEVVELFREAGHTEASVARWFRRGRGPRAARGLAW